MKTPHESEGDDAQIVQLDSPPNDPAKQEQAEAGSDAVPGDGGTELHKHVPEGEPASSTPDENAKAEIVNGKVRVDRLRPHPDNVAIYGLNDSIRDLVKSVGASGLIDELVITKEGFVLSGNRRRRVAIELGLNEVPARMFESDDELAIKEALLEFNRQRVKSGAQMASEANFRLQIEAQRKRSQQKSSDGQKVENLPPPTRGKARDAVGAAMGISGRTVAKAATAAKAVAKLRADGRDDDAAEVEEALNKSIDKGLNTAKAKGVVAAKKKGSAKKSDPVGTPNQPAQPALAVSEAPIAKAKIDSDAAVELQDQVISFLREIGPNRLTPEQKKTWKKILQEIQAILATLI
jgi:ParB-like chromosome segregation protein Spo0J